MLVWSLSSAAAFIRTVDERKKPKVNDTPHTVGTGSEQELDGGGGVQEERGETPVAWEPGEVYSGSEGTKH